MDEFERELAAVLDGSERQGYVTWAQLNELLAMPGTDPARLDRILRAIEGRGLDILDPDEAAGGDGEF
jgi:hypothetical protein